MGLRLSIPVGVQLDLPIPNIAAVLEVYNRIEIHRSTTGKTGTYSEVTTASDRIQLDQSTSLYRYIDPEGDQGAWYKARLSHASSAAVSPFSEPLQGSGDGALSFLSAEELRSNYLFGIDLTDGSGNQMPDSLLEFYVKSAVSWVETYLDMPLRPTAFNERHDFIWRDWQEWGSLRANQQPIISVESLTLTLPGSREPTVIPESWISLRGGRSRSINVIPVGGFQQLFATGGTWWAVSLASTGFVPHAFELQYTAGFLPESLPEVIRDVVGKLAAHGPLNIAGDLIAGAGIASKSISMDGLSQSINTTSSATNSGYGARLVQYNKEIKEMLPTIRDRFHGPELLVG